jgi:prepilin-type N-terminal cleavage/methylation domain-containing protein
MPTRRHRGFTLIELMIVVAVIGLLIAVALPAYDNYVLRAKSSDGYVQFSALKPAMGDFYQSNGRLPANFPELGLPAATGSAYGGDTASYEHAFGVRSDVWQSVEYQPKNPHGYVFVLRSRQSPDVGLHFQIKAARGIIRIRCTVNGDGARVPYVPAHCAEGVVTEWDW